MNSELPIATKEKDQEVTIYYSFKTSALVKSKMPAKVLSVQNKDKTSASTKPQESPLGIHCWSLHCKKKNS